MAIELVRRYGPDIMAVARRYSGTREDAEDAYQRGLEILLTKAPATSAEVLVPWLKTVVKHEAFALHRARERAGQPTAPERIAAHAHAARAAAPPEDQAERLERLQIGAEALARLKPQEIRCMLLLAEGHSYRQIQELTGFSYTKVNRCLTEGRRSFLRRVEGIESGEECERLAPLLSALADGEASAKDMAALRPHLRTCLSCRAALRDAREVPARVAALAPIGLLAGAGAGHAPGGGLLSALRSGWDTVTERLTSLALRGQDLIETASSHKIAAAAASAAALGGGGIATVEVGGHGERHQDAPPTPTVVAKRASSRVPAPAARLSAPAQTVPMERAGRPRKRQRAPVARDTHPSPRRPAVPVTEEPPPPLAGPEPASRQTVRPPAPARPEPATGEFGP